MKPGLRQLNSGILILYRGLSDPEVPWYVKLLFFLVVIYVISPIDLVPDFIPVLGLVDEIILVPLLTGYMLRLLPEHVKQRHLREGQSINPGWLKTAGLLLVLSVWLLLSAACYTIWRQVF